MALDGWWSRGPQNNRRAKRKRVYKWLMEVTGMSRDDCHIAKFDRGVCEAVLHLVKQVNIGLLPRPKL